jgi:hypothetical protein
MSPAILDRARRAGAALTLIAGAGFVLVYLAIALLRIRYPYELEWMEGGMLDHVRRVLDGAPLYAPPSVDFVSFLYPPLYYWAAAALSAVLGPGFVPLRLLSLASSVGVLWLLAAMVRRETGSLASGALAAGLFAATYGRVGGWFDLARLDSFYLLLLLAAAFALRTASRARGAVVAGVLVTAAALTKQSGIVIVAAMGAGALLADRRRGAWFAGTALVGIGASFAALDATSGGWFRYYCFTLPSHHPRVPDGLTAFWTADLLPALPIATLLAVGFAVTRWRGRGGLDRFFYPLTAAGMIASSWSVRNMVGAEVNNLLPAFAGVALLAALGVAALEDRARGSESAGMPAAAAAVAWLLLVQLAVLRYDPRAHLPSAADREAGDGLVARLKSIEGDIFIPHHGYLTRLAGKRDFAHTLAMDNVYLDDDGPARRELESGMRAALQEKRFAAVLLESDGRYGVAILNSYDARENLFARDDVFWPVTGGRLRPEVLCLPK